MLQILQHYLTKECRVRKLYSGFLLGIFSGGHSLLLCKFLLLLYCFRPNFREGQKFSRGDKLPQGGAPPPVGESQVLMFNTDNRSLRSKFEGLIRSKILGILQTEYP